MTKEKGEDLRSKEQNNILRPMRVVFAFFGFYAMRHALCALRYALCAMLRC